MSHAKAKRFSLGKDYKTCRKLRRVFKRLVAPFQGKRSSIALAITIFFVLISGQLALYAEAVSVQYKAGERYEITITPESFVFPSVEQSHYVQGYIEALAACSVSIDSNRSWEVSICCLESCLGTLGGKEKPLSDFYWKLSDETNWSAISQTSNVIFTGIRKFTKDVDFRVLLNWEDDTPGTYELTLTLTIGASA